MTRQEELIKAEIERLIKQWELGDSTEAKYRCEAYKELLHTITSKVESAEKDLNEDNPKPIAVEIEKVVESISNEWRERQNRLLDMIERNHRAHFINKACDWLEEVIVNVKFRKEGMTSSYSGIKNLIHHFRKAMES